MVDLSAIATRNARLPLALAVGGAIVLMAGVSMALIGEVMKLEHPAGWQGLVTLGLMLAAAGLFLGAAFAIVIILGPQPQDYAGRAGRAQRPGEKDGHAAVDSADEWLNPLRTGGIRPVGSAAGRAAAAYFAERYPDGSHLGAEYADEGWQLDGPGLAVHAQPAPHVQPAPHAQPAAQEVHHPVRPMAASRPPGHRLGDTGQFPAYSAGVGPDQGMDRPPADDTGQQPVYDTGQQPVYDGQQPARLSAPPPVDAGSGWFDQDQSTAQWGQSHQNLTVTRAGATRPGTTRSAGEPRPR
jgi:hypothetical protein